jgi:hypothetical protein
MLSRKPVRFVILLPSVLWIPTGIMAHFLLFPEKIDFLLVVCRSFRRIASEVGLSRGERSDNSRNGRLLDPNRWMQIAFPSFLV